jgi:Domain of unknown function (DUF3885)
VDSSITKESLLEIFGPRAFEFGLFYANEGAALRFELSTGGEYVDMFTQAYDRGREILDHVFRDSDRLVVVAKFLGAGRLAGHVSVFRALKRCGVRVEAPWSAWTETLEEEWDTEEWTHFAFAVEKDALHRLLWGAAAVDLGIRPRLLCYVYLADPARGILAHPYDDRGMDVIGPNQPLLRELFTRFNDYLLDYDRERMNAWFGDGSRSETNAR